MSKITASDLRRQADALIAAGRMPSLETLLTAVAEARMKYAPLILAERDAIVIRLDDPEHAE